MTMARVLRRGTAAPSFDPSTVSGLVAWYIADDLALADATAVSSWTDRAGTPHNAVQATGTKQPLYKTAILNGHAVLRFDGIDDFLRSPLTLSQPDTVFVAFKSLVGASGVRVITDGGSLNSHLLRSFSNWEIYAGGAVVGAVAADTSAHVLAATYNGASSSLRVAGGAGDSGSAGTGGMTALTIGIAGDQTNFPGNYDIAEVLIYNSALVLTDMNHIGSYLASKYGTTWTTAT